MRKHRIHAVRQSLRKATAAKTILQKKKAKTAHNRPAMMTAAHHA